MRGDNDRPELGSDSDDGDEGAAQGEDRGENGHMLGSENEPYRGTGSEVGSGYGGGLGSYDDQYDGEDGGSMRIIDEEGQEGDEEGAERRRRKREEDADAKHVQWPDDMGDSLTDVREFEPSESSEEEDEDDDEYSEGGGKCRCVVQ